MTAGSLELVLADDDADDCIFFREALKDVPMACILNTVNDGDQLMRMLTTATTLPDALFLDLNMPRKSGFECLSEIKLNKKLAALPVIIYSTSLDRDVVNLLYDKGALYYIRKPGDFVKLKKVIQKVLLTIFDKKEVNTTREHFVIQA